MIIKKQSKFIHILIRTTRTLLTLVLSSLTTPLLIFNLVAFVLAMFSLSCKIPLSTGPLFQGINMLIRTRDYAGCVILIVGIKMELASRVLISTLSASFTFTKTGLEKSMNPFLPAIDKYSNLYSLALGGSQF